MKSKVPPLYTRSPEEIDNFLNELAFDIQFREVIPLEEAIRKARNCGFWTQYAASIIGALGENRKNVSMDGIKYLGYTDLLKYTKKGGTKSQR